MEKYVDKLLLLIPGSILIFSQGITSSSILILLLVIAAGCLSSYTEEKRIRKIIFFVSLAAGIFDPGFFTLIILCCYDQNGEKYDLVTLAALIPYFLYMGEQKPAFLLLWLTLPFFALYLARKSSQLAQSRRELVHQRDQSTEMQILLKDRNRDLLQKQDYEIHVAMLQERNRIAREIHDTVGHMLSRALLQTGAIMALEADPQKKETIGGLKDTLSDAMSSIRESVHDLHDESLNLELSIQGIVDPLKNKVKVELTLDLAAPVPRILKYLFLGVIKEGVSNLLRHSDASQVHILLREHPGFYQLGIEDNGSPGDQKVKEGMGLTNIRDRVEAVQGSVRFFHESGFRIFVSIPKERSTDESFDHR